MNILSKFGQKIMIFDKVITLFVFWTFKRLLTVHIWGSLYKIAIKFEVEVLRSPNFAKMCLIEWY